MLRLFLGALVLLAFSLSPLSAQQKDLKDLKGKDQPAKAKITKVNPKNHTITVRMKDKNGQEKEKTFKLTEDVRMLDSTGKVVAIDVFQAGNDVLVIEREGKLVEMRKHQGQGKSKVNKPL